MTPCTNYPGCGCAYGDCVIRSDSTEFIVAGKTPETRHNHNLPETPDGSCDRVIVWPHDHDEFGDPGDEHGGGA